MAFSFQHRRLLVLWPVLLRISFENLCAWTRNFCYSFWLTCGCDSSQSDSKFKNAIIANINLARTLRDPGILQTMTFILQTLILYVIRSCQLKQTTPNLHLRILKSCMLLKKWFYMITVWWSRILKWYIRNVYTLNTLQCKWVYDVMV